ncbi:MAG TPA: DUF4124 domain-containing protein [Pseudoxanthomonas sp.]|nr:DUF4124 domain-containing protein [Pseudoxanthomonas sp.]
MRSALLVILGCLVFSAHADEVAIYRCTDAGGAVTMQNMPCPKGMHQEKKLMQGITTVPMADKAAPAKSTPAAQPPSSKPVEMDLATPAADASDTASAPSDLTKLPPPKLFRCTTRESSTYVTEESEPPERCLPLRTVGLDGNPQTGAGNACEVVRDSCAPIPDEGLCAAWKKRHDEAEVAWRFTRPESEEKNRQEFERAQRILAESNCAGR